MQPRERTLMRSDVRPPRFSHELCEAIRRGSEAIGPRALQDAIEASQAGKYGDDLARSHDRWSHATIG